MQVDSAVLEDVVTSVCNEDRYHYGFNGKIKDNEWAGVGNDYDYGARNYQPRIARFISVDPLAKQYPWYSSYQYAGNKPIKFIDRDGLEEADPAMEPVLREEEEKDERDEELHRGLKDEELKKPTEEEFVRNRDNQIKRNNATLIKEKLESDPFTREGQAKNDRERQWEIAKPKARDLFRRMYPEMPFPEELKYDDELPDTNPGVTYQTYFKPDINGGPPYSGRTSGRGTPEENIAKRDMNHSMTAKGYGPARLDRSSSNEAAIRGREQVNIDRSGGAKSDGGTSPNAIRGVSAKNPKRGDYEKAAKSLK